MRQPHSPATGTPVRGDWSREQWLAHADRMLAGARRHASENGARITPPGTEGGYGRAVDGLEGFARTFLLAGFRIAGARGEGLDELIDQYANGIRAGVDPSAPDRWVRIEEHDQAKVEAASLALILDMTRPWIWDQLDAATQERLIAYLAPVVGDATYPKTNWLWFRIVVQTFLRSVGGPWSADDIAADLALHDSLARGDGWLSDGAERSYDHYIGWALHLYPVLWSRMQGGAELAAGRIERDRAALDRFLLDARAMVGADGSPMLQGRSLIYRFAAAAPFWAGVLAEVPSTSPGALRHAAARIVGHFAERGAPDAEGLLTIGWHHPWRPLAQSYSGPGSPYWAAKGMLGIALPADHPVWRAPAEPLPVETADYLRVVRPAGWIVSGTAADGIVRLTNHGTDHAAPGARTGDSPLYARIGYSTATAPLLDAHAWREPLEQSVVLVDAAGNATHRTAMDLVEARVDGAGAARVGIAAGRWDAHIVRPEPTSHHHGSGLAGAVTPAGRLTVHSLVRGPWEIRVVEVGDLDPAAGSLRLRIGGWPVSGDRIVHGVATSDHKSLEPGPVATATTGDGLVSAIRGLDSQTEAAVATRADATPLGTSTSVPTLECPARPGLRVVALIELTSARIRDGDASASAALRAADGGLSIDATWPDGIRTTTTQSTGRQP